MKAHELARKLLDNPLLEVTFKNHDIAYGDQYEEIEGVTVATEKQYSSDPEPPFVVIQ